MVKLIFFPSPFKVLGSNSLTVKKLFKNFFLRWTLFTLLSLPIIPSCLLTCAIFLAPQLILPTAQPKANMPKSHPDSFYSSILSSTLRSWLRAESPAESSCVHICIINPPIVIAGSTSIMPCHVGEAAVSGDQLSTPLGYQALIKKLACTEISCGKKDAAGSNEKM